VDAETHKEFALVTFGLLQNCVDPTPGLRVLLECCHEGIDLLALVVVTRGVHRHDNLPVVAAPQVSTDKAKPGNRRRRPSALHSMTHLVQKGDIERLAKVEQLIKLRHLAPWRPSSARRILNSRSRANPQQQAAAKWRAMARSPQSLFPAAQNSGRCHALFPPAGSCADARLSHAQRSPSLRGWKSGRPCSESVARPARPSHARVTLPPGAARSLHSRLRAALPPRCLQRSALQWRQGVGKRARVGEGQGAHASASRTWGLPKRRGRLWHQLAIVFPNGLQQQKRLPLFFHLS